MESEAEKEEKPRGRMDPTPKGRGETYLRGERERREAIMNRRATEVEKEDTLKMSMKPKHHSNFFINAKTVFQIQHDRNDKSQNQSILYLFGKEVYLYLRLKNLILLSN